LGAYFALGHDLVLRALARDEQVARSHQALNHSLRANPPVFACILRLAADSFALLDRDVVLLASGALLSLLAKALGTARYPHTHERFVTHDRIRECFATRVALPRD
jgi:hypothetical protein